jgi:predicted esterase
MIRKGVLARSLLGFWVALTLTTLASAAVIRLRDGRVLEGSNYWRLKSLVLEPPRAGQDDEIVPHTIVMVEDGLRRVFVPHRHVVDALPEATLSQTERFRIPQPSSTASRQISSVGLLVSKTPFDDFGRRTVELLYKGGAKPIIQGISEITPRYVAVNALEYAWQERLATSSIPDEELDRILRKRIDPGNSDHRLRLARFYIQAKKYSQARDELNAVRDEFPDRAASVDGALASILQIQARQLVDEIQLRLAAGQYKLAGEMLERFPTEGVAGDVLEEVRALVLAREEQAKNQQKIYERIESFLGQLPADGKRNQLETILSQITSALDFETLSRLGAFLNLADDASLPPDEKLALAITGWLMGGDAAKPDPVLALSLAEARDLVSRFLAEKNPLERKNLVARIRNLEGVGVEQMARVVEHLTPPLDAGPIVPGKPFSVTVPGWDPQYDLTYWVQLPPEYTPYHNYPTIVTLNGGGSTPQMQLDWWADQQAGRRGYIVLAPEYAAANQRTYQYGEAEHRAVLGALVDARKRFAVDSGRVFLSGYSMGGDAAWDIGLAHPGAFAGVIPISGVCDQFCHLLQPNAEQLPLYVVGGEKDSDRPKRNAQVLDRMMTRRYDVTYVEYIGRGHENFYEEIHSLFDWMALQRRVEYPKKFECKATRPWEDRFYWVEVKGVPAPPVGGPDGIDLRRVRAYTIRGRIGENNTVYVDAGQTLVTVWLGPEQVDFNERVRVSINGRDTGIDVEPSLETLLEDFRVRGDRQMLFWASVVADRQR